jgi:predicted RNase H-like nuclease (RuvC/YqgF family)
MDLTRFELLETCITHLLHDVDRVRAENTQLRQHVHDLQKQLSDQQKTLVQLQREREEWLPMRTTLQAMQQERELIQQKLQHMLATIEWLEAHIGAENDTKL